MQQKTAAGSETKKSRGEKRGGGNIEVEEIKIKKKNGERVGKIKAEKREKEGGRSPFTQGGRAAGGEAPQRHMKIMRTFLSGKIYKIVPVLLKFKTSRFFFSPSTLPPSL